MVENKDQEKIGQIPEQRELERPVEAGLTAPEQDPAMKPEQIAEQRELAEVQAEVEAGGLLSRFFRRKKDDEEGGQLTPAQQIDDFQALQADPAFQQLPIHRGIKLTNAFQS